MKHIRKSLLVIALGFELFSESATARTTLPSKVRLEQADGYTPWTTVNVTFATGLELDRLSGAYSYNDIRGRYAVIPLGSDGISVVKLTGTSGCLGLFGQNCIPVGAVDGVDQQGRHWQVCTAPTCT